MSILEEALRRRELEGKPPPVQVGPLPKPPSLPRDSSAATAASASSRRGRVGRWVKGLLALLLIAALGAVLWYNRDYWWGYVARQDRPVPAVTPTEPAEPLPPQEKRRMEAAAEKTSSELSGVMSRVLGTMTEGFQQAIQQATQKVGRDAGVATPAPPEPTATAPVPKDIRWPKLRLQVVLAGKGTTPSLALINGRQLRVGDRIEGARVVAIEGEAVLLEYQGVQRYLRIGEPWE